MKNNFPGGVWPVMLTPFTSDNKVDYEGLAALTEWYIGQGADGLFAVTQSSEMFFMSLEERIRVAAFVKEKASGRVPVIASGHISDEAGKQTEEIARIAETGVDAVILVSNRLARQDESNREWISNLQGLLEKIPEEIKLGLYECPYPYKRILDEEMTEWCAKSGRFYFLKDTSCDMENIRRKLAVCRGTELKLYNANTATLRESLLEGAAGYSGVMANMQCRLYGRLLRDFRLESMEELSEALTMCALIEKQWYPTNAKFYLQQEGVPITIKCRVQDDSVFTETWKREMRMLKNVTLRLEEKFMREEDEDGRTDKKPEQK